MQKKAPVLFIFFNRLSQSLQAFSKIKEYKPSKLYLAADGARNDKEREVCEKVRNAISEEIDWECEVHCNFSNINLGARFRIESAINWAFLKEEALIILEDDCLASVSFFPYCETLLEKYQGNTSVMMISGTNEALEIDGEKDYYFSRLPHTWGWATWKRAWKLYDYELTLWKKNKKFYKKNLAEQFDNDIRMYSKRMNEVEMLRKGTVDTWDYRWFLTFHYHGGLSIAPPKNLISNIGFGTEATHTFDEDSKLSNMESFVISGEYIDNDQKIESTFHDAYLNNRITRYSAYLYIMKTILFNLNMDFFKKELVENGVESFFVLGTKDLGKLLSSKVSSIIEFNGFCGNDISYEVFEEWLIRNPTMERSSTIIISSIEGEHEKEILSKIVKKIAVEIKVISWKDIVWSYISKDKAFENISEDKQISYIQDNLNQLIEKEVI